VSYVLRWHGRSLRRRSRAPIASVLLSSSPSEPSADLHEHGSKFSRALFAELRRLGQIEGQNLKVESYGREQNTPAPKPWWPKIVRSNPDVILVAGPDALIFKKLTSRIPIVVITGDPR
jgi:putative tryptophan/tyrosine transport system substrate-binding protein